MPMRTKEQQRAYQLAWITSRRNEWIAENGPCNGCGTWNRLDIDHIDHKTKLYSVSSLWSLSKANPKRVSELAKCQVLCEECHKLKTEKDLGYGLHKHGTTTNYTLGCRCVECKKSSADARRVLRAKNKGLVCV